MLKVKRPARQMRVTILAGITVGLLLASCGSSGHNSSATGAGTTSGPSSGGTNGATGAAPAGQSCTGTVPVGSVFSLSGELSAYDVPGEQGTALAINQINQTGFDVNGKCYKFKVYSADAKSDIPTGVAEVHQIIQSDHPVAIFGPVTSEVAAPASEYSSAHKVIEIGASSADASLLAPCAAGQNSSTCGQSNSTLKYFIATEGWGASPVGEQEEQAFLKDHNVKSVAWLWPDDAVGKADSPVGVAQLKQYGVKVVYDSLFPDTTSDFSPYVTKIAQLHPDMIDFGYATTWMIPIMTLARQENAARIYDGAVSIDPALHSGSTTDTSYYFSTPVVTQYDASPSMQTFINTFQNFTHTTVGIDTQFAYVLTEYPEVYLLVKAMQQAGTVTNTSEIIKYMRGVTMTTPGNIAPPMPVTSFGVVEVPESSCSLSPAAASTPPASVTIKDIQCTLYSANVSQ